MKTMLILVAGIAPLAVLTLSSIFGNVRAIALEEVDASKANFESAAKLSQAGIDASTKDAAIVQRLVELDVFRKGTLPDFNVADENRYKPVEKSWSDLTKAQAVGAALVEIYRKKPGSKEEIEGVRKFLDSNALANPGLVDDLKTCLQDRLETLLEREYVTDSLKKVRDLFQQQRFVECLRKLGEMKPVKAESLTDLERTELEKIRKKSTFGQHWQVLPASSDTVKNRLARLDKLSSTSPPANDAEDEDFLSRRRVEITQLQRQKRIGDLFESPPAQLRDLLEESERILKDDPDARERLREGVSTWLQARINEKQPPAHNALLKEAWQTDGVYKRGVFMRVNAKDVWYKYWDDVNAFKLGNTYLTIYLSELKKAPAKMTEVRVCEDYNAARQTLLKKFDSERTWREFGKQCETLQTELNEYYSPEQLKGAPLSFDAERGFALEVLGEWTRVEILLK